MDWGFGEVEVAANHVFYCVEVIARYTGDKRSASIN